MYFKSLELIGFKSFAEKTKLNFEAGVTAIVGPNGCGKSNVADGIRWVLGEQSAKSLRASTMQDVIFNGTDTKEPINFAEVSLSFSNENRILPIDYDEVTITRRVFRSGESEYLLNKTPVRLKDISDLLMGTGIGTESYSIIEQGKMDLILSSKPEDRRYVFEEASGITKYKSKKKEAMRKLEQTEQNLLRINDIILEVKRQIGSIERQARKAEKYKVDFDKLKEMELKLSYTDYKDIKAQEAVLSVESEDAKARERESGAIISDMSANLTKDRQILSDINNRIADFKNKFSELSNALDMNKHKIDIDRERISENIASKEGIRKEIEFIGEKISGVKLLIEKLKTDLEAIIISRRDKESAVNERNIKLDDITRQIGDTESKVSVFKSQIIEFLSKETQLKNDLIKVGVDIQNKRSRQRRLEIEKEEVIRELNETEMALLDVFNEFKSIDEKVLSLKLSIESKTKAFQASIADIKNIESEIALQLSNKAAIASKLEILEDNLKSYEGFRGCVKEILSKSKGENPVFKGILGVLADIIQVERGYEEAFTILLGDDAETIITETDDDIKSAIEYLKSNNLGKASFISLETLARMKKVEAPAQSDNTLMKSFIRIEPRFESIADHFLLDTYLAESFEEGLNRMGSSHSTFVTKSGNLFYRGKVSGGSSAGNEESLLIGRRQRLDDLRFELKNTEDRISFLTANRDDKSLLSARLEEEINIIDNSIRQEDMSLSNTRIKKDAQEENVRRLKDETALLNSELDEINKSIEEMNANGNILNEELNKIESEKSAMQSFIDESQAMIHDKKSERENISLEVATLKAEVQSLTMQEDIARSGIVTQEKALFEFEDSLGAKESLLKESDERIKNFEQEICNLSNDNESIAINIETLSRDIVKVESEKADLNIKLQADEGALKTKENEIDSLRNFIRDLDVRLTEFNFKKTNLKDRILQAYKMDLEGFTIEVEDGIDWESVKLQVGEIKEKLDKMGPVNLVAIDEHKELEERYNFLTHQQEDLVNAKDSLMKAIQKINKTTKELFIDTFQKIQVEFKNFFRMLFGGGQAELVLMDEQDILESGIEIIVRPPGKKLQNLMLLSGGEKAMTACALLFAVFKVKPSPFCVLDELDAPLDESNVMRFAGVLKEFIKLSQFIIITHNKRTMELADVIYGVTMQERGVSKIVSVKFLDDRDKNKESASIESKEDKASNAASNINPQETIDSPSQEDDQKESVPTA